MAFFLKNLKSVNLFVNMKKEGQAELVELGPNEELNLSLLFTNKDLLDSSGALAHLRDQGLVCWCNKEPAVVEPAVVEPAVVEPAVVEPAVVEKPKRRRGLKV